MTNHGGEALTEIDVAAAQKEVDAILRDGHATVEKFARMVSLRRREVWPVTRAAVLLAYLASVSMLGRLVTKRDMSKMFDSRMRIARALRSALGDHADDADDDVDALERMRQDALSETPMLGMDVGAWMAMMLDGFCATSACSVSSADVVTAFSERWPMIEWNASKAALLAFHCEYQIDPAKSRAKIGWVVDAVRDATEVELGKAVAARMVPDARAIMRRLFSSESL